MLLNGGHIINFFLSFCMSGFSFFSKIGKMHLAMEIIKGQLCSQSRALHHPSVLTKNSVELVSLRLSLEISHGMRLVPNEQQAKQDLKEPSTT